MVDHITDTKNLPELMTREELADLLRVSVSTLKRWNLEGVGPQPLYLRPRVPRYRRTDVLRYLISLTPSPRQESAPEQGDTPRPAG